MQRCYVSNVFLACSSLQHVLIMSAGFIHPWVIGGYWALPLQYIQNAIAINELTGGVPYPALLSALPSLLPADSRTMCESFDAKLRRNVLTTSLIYCIGAVSVAVHAQICPNAQA